MSAFSQNTEYTTMLPLVEQIRDIVRGSPFIKAERDKYLPHPSSVDTNSPEQKARYAMYLAGAEFDEFTNVTQRVMLGRMKLDDMTFTPDSKIDYLREDVDKDGLSMKGLAESCAKNITETKWHMLLCDYQGLSDLGLQEISAQDIKDANPRSTIKQYARENVLDWDFQRINGAMQLTYLLLLESGSEVNHDTGQREDVYSYLRLGVDEIGYYQQKTSLTIKTETPTGFGEKNYVSVGGESLKFIPAIVVCDEEIPSGKLPMELGYLSTLGDLALARYQVSAKYKEAMNALIPTIHVMGVNDTDWAIFKEVNGRDYMSSGVFAPNIWPDPETSVQIIESAASLEQFTKYFEDNKEKVKALGGVFNSEAAVQRTATEIVNESETTNSILLPMVNNIESSLKWAVAYCAMFEAVVKPDALGDYVETVELSLSREFGMSRLSTEEVKVLVNDIYLNSVMSKEEILRILVAGGWSESALDEILGEIEEGL